MKDFKYYLRAILPAPVLCWLRTLRMRQKWQKNGVRVQTTANIFAAYGLSMGSGTIIYPHCTIACSFLSHDDSFDMANRGSISFGLKCIVMPGAIVATYGGNISIGNEVSINPGVILYGHGGLVIGNFVRIAAQTIIVSANHVFADENRPIKDQGLNCKGIIIEDDVWIGAGVRVLDGVTIGKGSIIAAGAVVTRSFPPNSIICGVPARLVRHRGAAQSPATP